MFCRLIVEVSSYPPPRFTWSLNGQIIKPSQRYRMAYDKGIITLVIMSAQPQDAGDYLLRATNELGEISCKTTLHVKRK